MIASSDDNSYTNGSQIEKQTEVIQIAIEEGIFVVPFNFKSD